MLKTVLAGTTALVIAGASLAYAQQPPRGPRGDHWRPSATDISAFTDARIAGLKAGLKLTADQEKNWPAVETALRDLAKQRAERFAARQTRNKDRKADDQANQQPKRDPIQRLGERADRMAQTAAGLKKLADAAAPLYQSLDEGQKHRFAMLARIGMRGMNRGFERQGRHHGGHGWRHHGPRGQGHHGNGHHGKGHHGMGRDGGPAGGSGDSQRL